MPQKSVPVSVRLPAEDAAFLEHTSVEGADTPSEKLRAIVAEARLREHGTSQFDAALQIAQGGVRPTLQIIRNNEREHRVHSELVSRLGEWLPDCMAYLVACNGSATELSVEKLTEIERDLADRVLVLIQSVLQMGVTRRSPCYDPSVIDDRLEPVLDLTEAISRTRSDGKRNQA